MIAECSRGFCLKHLGIRYGSAASAKSFPFWCRALQLGLIGPLLDPGSGCVSGQQSSVKLTNFKAAKKAELGTGDIKGDCSQLQILASSGGGQITAVFENFQISKNLQRYPDFEDVQRAAAVPQRIESFHLNRLQDAQDFVDQLGLNKTFM